MIAIAKAPGSSSLECRPASAPPASAAPTAPGDQGDAVLVESTRRRRAGCRRPPPRAGRGPAARRAARRPARRASPPRTTTCHPADVAESVDHAPHLGEEVVGVRVAGDAEQLRQLAGGDGQPDADLDAGERRLGDVVDQRRRARSRRATSRIAPTMQRQRRQVASPGRPRRPPRRRRSSVDPVSTAIVEVVLTDSVREPPSRAYTAIGTMHV